MKAAEQQKGRLCIDSFTAGAGWLHSQLPDFLATQHLQQQLGATVGGATGGAGSGSQTAPTLREGSACEARVLEAGPERAARRACCFDRGEEAQASREAIARQVERQVAIRGGCHPSQQKCREFFGCCRHAEMCSYNPTSIRQEAKARRGGQGREDNRQAAHTV